jgi:two-component system sensor histidine kinase/response regulator
VFTNHSPREGQRQLRVLLAEDNPINRILMISLLEKNGHDVVIAEDGIHAVAAYASEQVDVILMDVQMPGMDGLEATAEIRQRERASGTHIPIIAVTAHAMKGDKERCLAAGMDFYITKPVRPNELWETLDAAMQRHQQRVAAHSTGLAARGQDRLAFDPVEALSRVGDDRDLFAKMVAVLRGESARMLAAIRSGMAAGDARALTRAAHALKGCVGNFGPNAAFDTAQELENTSRERVPANAADLLGTLEAQMARLERDLASFVAPIGQAV